MNRYRKTSFDLDKALSGEWVAHVSVQYEDHRLQLRVEDNNWHARITNPDITKRLRRPYIDRSLKCKAKEVETALTKAAAFYRETIAPTVEGPTFNRVLDDYIRSGCPCKIGRGQTYGARTPKAQAVCANLLTRAARLIGDMPLTSDLWEDAVAGIADKMGGPVNFLKTTGMLRAMLGWAKRVKRLKVGELPSRAADPMATRAGIENAAEYGRLLDAIADPWLKAHVRFLRHVGCRPGNEIEIAAIRFRDVANALSADGWVEVEITKPKPGTPQRTAVADAALLGVIDAIRAIHPTPLDPDALIFPPMEYGRAFKAVLAGLAAAQPDYPWLTDAAGNDRTLYSLRHYHASERAADAGRWNADNLSKHLGNTPEVCRRHYLKWNKKRIRAAMPKAA